jgi:glycosyltransferase involved in cell wall biosynthesis
VPPRDPAALAAAIGEALSLSADDRRNLARRAMAHVSARYTREAMCARTIQVYEELLFPQSTYVDVAAQ